MLDDLYLDDYAEGIDLSIANSFDSFVIPNPAIDQLEIIYSDNEYSNCKVLVYDSMGKLANQRMVCIAASFMHPARIDN